MTDNINNSSGENNNNEAQEVVEAAPTPEVTMFTQEQFDEKVAGIVKNRDDLLTELKQKATAQQEKSLKDGGDFNKLKEHYDERLAELDNKYKNEIASKQEQILKRDKLDVVNKLVGSFVDSEVGNHLLKSLVEVDGERQIFRDFSGKIVADNLEDFKSWMQTNEHMSHLIQGSKATGGGALGSTGSAKGADTSNLSGLALLEATRNSGK